MLLLVQLPAGVLELIVEMLNELNRFFSLGANYGVHRFAEKPEKCLSAPIEEVESGVAEDPVIVPVIVVIAMLPNVADGVFVATVRGGKGFKLIQPTQKLNIIELPIPLHVL
ncbi:hypothetical protein D3C85_1478050 [compost metagenome]